MYADNKQSVSTRCKGGVNVNVKDVVTKNPDCILYFGDNKAFFLSALKDVGTSQGDIKAISYNAEFELKTKELPAHYVIVVKDGKWSEWNVINSEKHFGKEFWRGYSPLYNLPVFNLALKSAKVV